MGYEQYKNILGFYVFNGNADQLITELEQRTADSTDNLCLFYANSNFIQQCHADVDLFTSQNIIIANDGIALDLAARYLTGSAFSTNLNGTDFTPYLIQTSSLFKRVFLLGGKPGVASAAASILASQPGIKVVGYADGYDCMNDEVSLIEKINAAAPDILLLALGNPKQEYWLLQHKDRLQVKLLVGVGALLDFMSGNVPRAPLWIQHLKCEWLFRLFGEPKRLFRRYTIDMARFFWLCIQYQKRLKQNN